MDGWIKARFPVSIEDVLSSSFCESIRFKDGPAFSNCVLFKIESLSLVSDDWWTWSCMKSSEGRLTFEFDSLEEILSVIGDWFSSINGSKFPVENSEIIK